MSLLWAEAGDAAVNLYHFIPGLFLLAAAPAALAAEAVWTAGPIALCESESVVLTAYNRGEQAAAVGLELFDAESGRSLDQALVEVLAHTAEQLSYYQDRVANESYLDTSEKEGEDGCRRPRMIVARASSPGPVSFVGVVRGPAGDRRFDVEPLASDGKGRFTSETAFLDPARANLLALVNLGPKAVTLTYELANPVSGKILARRSVRLEPFGSAGGLPCGGACEFLTLAAEAPTNRTKVLPVALTGLTISEEAADADVAFSISSAPAGETQGDVVQWRLQQAWAMK